MSVDKQAWDEGKEVRIQSEGVEVLKRNRERDQGKERDRQIDRE